MTFKVPKLNFAQDALEPYLSADVVHYHYEKHTKGYFKKTNELIKGTMFEKVKSLDSLVHRKSLVRAKTALYNSAMQAYNHSLYWENLAPPKETGTPNEQLKEALVEKWKTVEAFQNEFNKQGIGGFGSTWCWLVITNDKLNIVVTNNADNPIWSNQGEVLLVIDGWEHSWYVQYFNDKKAYFKAIWNVVNWNVVNERFDKATKNT